MSNLTAISWKLIRSDDGATFFEYGMLVALIALAVVASATTLGTTFKTFYSNATTSL